VIPPLALTVAMFWLDDLAVVLLVVLASSLYLIFQLFLKNQSTFSFWEKLAIQKQLSDDAHRSIHTIDHNQLMQHLDQRHAASNAGQSNGSTTDHTTFVLSEYSLPVCRSLWRIVEYVLSDFIDFWWMKISDSSDFGNDLRDVFDHAFNVLGERCIKIDWSPFIVKNVISNLNYLMRIYRLTEQGQRSSSVRAASTCLSVEGRRSMSCSRRCVCMLTLSGFVRCHQN
jgi:hypothetical protein